MKPPSSTELELSTLSLLARERLAESYRMARKMNVTSISVG